MLVVVKEAFTAADKNASQGLQHEELASAPRGGGGGYAYHAAGWSYLVQLGAPDADFVDKNAKDGAEMLLRWEDVNSDGEVQLGVAVNLLSHGHGAGSGPEVQEVKEAFAALATPSFAGWSCLVQMGELGAGDVDKYAMFGAAVLLLTADAYSNGEVQLEKAVSVLA